MHIYNQKPFFSYSNLTGLVNYEASDKPESLLKSLSGSSVDISWKKISDRKYTPTESALTYTGYAFRGDSRPPGCIFTEGFKKEECHNDEVFQDKLKSMEVEFVDVESRSFCESEKQLSVNPNMSICLTENPYFATHFPFIDLEQPTYLYFCLVTKGVNLQEKAIPLKTDSNLISLTSSLNEIMTPRILSEHIVCAWPVKRERLYLRGRFDVVNAIKPDVGSLTLNKYVDGCVEKAKDFIDELRVIEKEKVTVVRTRSKMEIIKDPSLEFKEDTDSDDSLYS